MPSNVHTSENKAAPSLKELKYTTGRDKDYIFQ